MTKAQLMTTLAEETGLAKKDVVNFMDKLTDLAYKTAKKEGQFVLPGFGKLVKIDRKARMGRNPATGEQIQIPAKKVVKFKVAKAAKEAII